MKRFIFMQLVAICLLFLKLHISLAESGTVLIQSDTVKALETDTPPVFDGIDNDECWNNASWQQIDQSWIPWNESVDSIDFYGRYKVSWSAEKNLIYILLEVTDDIISDAYVKGESANIYNFDMFEVFIDEDKSGGYHVFDGSANDETSLGTNAENAFAYHVFTKFPCDKDTTTKFCVEDLTGTSWSTSTVQDYKFHFPDFVLKRDGNVSCWEFSLIVYNDTYSDNNINGARVKLSTNKIIGLSLACNDDDQPEADPTKAVRDNFFGSVVLTEATANDHWKNADGFGTLKLISTDQGTGNN